jgi:hypothetical protein
MWKLKSPGNPLSKADVLNLYFEVYPEMKMAVFVLTVVRTSNPIYPKMFFFLQFGKKFVGQAESRDPIRGLSFKLHTHVVRQRNLIHIHRHTWFVSEIKLLLVIL